MCSAVLVSTGNNSKSFCFFANVAKHCFVSSSLSKVAIGLTIIWHLICAIGEVCIFVTAVLKVKGPFGKANMG